MITRDSAYRLAMNYVANSQFMKDLSAQIEEAAKKGAKSTSASRPLTSAEVNYLSQFDFMVFGKEIIWIYSENEKMDAKVFLKWS